MYNFFQILTMLQDFKQWIYLSTRVIVKYLIFYPWDKDALPFIKTSTQQEKCSQTHYNWSFIRDNVSFCEINKLIKNLQCSSA